jgi:hypothetical protein
MENVRDLYTDAEASEDQSFLQELNQELEAIEKRAFQSRNSPDALWRIG